MNDLTKYLVEGILQEAETGIIVLLPGGFKPPHGGHLELAVKYSKLPNVSEVKILIGPKEREGITREQSITVWNELLIGTTGITVQKVAEDNPLLAAYKYIETAKPGTYALAASSKGEDYVRVKKFVEGHAEGSKYHKAGVNVIELPLDTKPLLYTGRTDGSNGKGVSASVLRQDLAKKDYKNFKTNYPSTIPENILRTIYNTLTKKAGAISESMMLLEGGAAGHLAHPYEDFDLTFKDIQNMINAALGGKLESAQEKLDGQNLMVTYKDGQVRAARNKGQVKDFGANSLTVQQVEDTFAGRGPIQEAFAEAMKDLEMAINKLSSAQKQKFFANGAKFVNLEVLYPPTANVVPYGASQLRLHHIKEYDKAGNVVGEDIEAVRQLQGAIRQVQAETQKTYEIRTTDPITIRKSAEYKAQKEELSKMIATIMATYKLKPTDKMGLYFQAWWRNYISQIAKGFQYTVPENTMMQLINRWCFGNKDTNIKVIRDGIQNEEFKNWVINFDKKDYNDQKKIAGKPIENLFLKLGVYTLGNIENLVSLNPNDSVRKMKNDLRSSIEQIKAFTKTDSTDDGAAALKFLKRELARLKDIGGFEAIMPTEGIVFKYNEKLYKLTGAFAPINQILGYLKF